MFANMAEVFELLVFVIAHGFALALFIGFISWAVWGVVSLFKSMSRG